MILPEGVRKIPLDKILPYNENDIIMFVSPDIALVIFSLRDDNKQVFSIKSIMMDNSSVFACTDFDKVIAEFGKTLLKPRLERFFETKKSEYIYFDKEEQIFIKNILDKNHLSGFVRICMKNKEGVFADINFDKIKAGEYKNIRSDLRSLGIMYFVTADRRYAENKVLNATKEEAKKSNPFSFRDMLKKRETAKVDKVFKRFPDFKVKTKQSVKAVYKMLSKIYHPDVKDTGDEKKFKELKSDYDTLKGSYWYKDLAES
jgi:hypothetical protein